MEIFTVIVFDAKECNDFLIFPFRRTKLCEHCVKIICPQIKLIFQIPEFSGIEIFKSLHDFFSCIHYKRAMRNDRLV